MFTGPHQDIAIKLHNLSTFLYKRSFSLSVTVMIKNVTKNDKECLQKI